MKNIHPATIIGVQYRRVISKKFLEELFQEFPTIVLFPATFAVAFQAVANKIRVTFADEKDTHYWYSHFTPKQTRLFPGYQIVF